MLALASWQPRFKSSYPETVFTVKAQKFSELLEHLSWLESTMAKAPAPPSDLLNLVNTYKMANIHLLELTMSETQDIVRLLKDEQITASLRPYLEQLRVKIDDVVMAYDGALAKAISSDFKAYTNFQRLNIQTLRNLIQAGSPRKERVWIIILDGMRLDSWDRFIWPKLRETFDLDGEAQLYLATLPSHTDISRVSLLAGKLPPFWKDYYNQPTSDHSILLSRYLSLGKDESKKKLKIVARVEEKVEQGELEFEDAQYRVMIFNISDDWIHHEYGSLVRVNEAITSKFEKMVLSELPDKIKAGDIVLITSDHGFIELRKKFSHKIEESQLGPGMNMDSISYRYIQNGKDDRRIRITYDNKNSWIMAQGYEWFERPKQSGKVARFSHGGISMAEMVVPAVRLRMRKEKKVELMWTIETPAECCSGDAVKLPIYLTNQGTVDTNVFLSCRVAGRLIAEDTLILPAGASHKWVVSVNADPKANQVSISAQYTLPNKEKKIEKRQVSIPIKERGGRVEIDTSALDVFEDS
ncbi:MAG: PglZ domain-containing protein [Candidatus Tectomicrobia bacterium]|uniref:PglZ domain-containing protein n=1 Tax=Tectimicrobiota bacterium TaxID=2528274 RepID=A0A933GNQ5_UNCTE|nr:PglZ domain-containing protein [Candidatus Tectomicrobia bacterium]